MELFAYADELCAKKRLDPHEDLFSVLTQAEIEGDQLSQLELDLFFLLLAVAGNETTRNLMSGAIVAFFDNPDQWERLRADRSLLPSAVEEMLRYVSPVMHFRRQATADVVIGDQTGGRRGQGGVLAHLGQPGRGGLPGAGSRSTSAAPPTTTWPSAAVGPTSAWAPTWPAWRSG